MEWSVLNNPSAQQQITVIFSVAWLVTNYVHSEFIIYYFDIYLTGLELGIWNSGCQSLVNPQILRVKHTHYVVKLPKSAGAGQYCPKIQWVTGTHTNSSPVQKV